jgi:hypothetical protein
VKTAIALLAATLLCGCNKTTSPERSEVEYTNSIQEELNTQTRIADFAYAYGKAEAVIEAQREKFGSDFGKNINIPDHSQSDMEKQVRDIFWNLQTNTAARDRVNSGE